jgi:hypothetical protein
MRARSSTAAGQRRHIRGQAPRRQRCCTATERARFRWVELMSYTLCRDSQVLPSLAPVALVDIDRGASVGGPHGCRQEDGACDEPAQPVLSPTMPFLMMSSPWRSASTSGIA